VVGEPRPCGEIAELAWFGPEAIAGLAPAAQLAFHAVFGGAGTGGTGGPDGAIPGA
jgi:hypothetical protein